MYFYKCKNCENVLKPKDEDCCVFCSYGNVKCIPRKAEKSRKVSWNLFSSKAEKCPGTFFLLNSL
ncbi:MAG TPA: GDCCVxC domain-containing (seleno)protein [Rickettsiales bacterium]|nr:GDCCVxC domain-containing (seleno)protein [Rickettsiales bacterium]